MKLKKENIIEASEMNHKLYKEGCRLYSAEKFQKAIVAFREATEYWPEDPQAWMALGNCYDEIGKPHRAEKCFKKALEYTPSKDKESIIYNLGNSLFDQNCFEEAIQTYNLIQSGSDLWRSAQRNTKLAVKKMSDKKSNKASHRSGHRSVRHKGFT